MEQQQMVDSGINEQGFHPGFWPGL